MISDLVTPDTVVAFDTPERTLVFNLVNYNYLAYSNDIWTAHALNMAAIQDRVDAACEKALKALDSMVSYFEHKDDPQIVAFFPNVEVKENEDGSFTFTAVTPRGVDGESIFNESEKRLAAEYMREYM